MNMKVKIAGVEFKNPVMTASGTFGSGAEYSEFVDLNRLGGVVTKGVANVPWAGNATPRIAEVHSGMMNAIGLQNPGIDVFCERGAGNTTPMKKACWRILTSAEKSFQSLNMPTICSKSLKCSLKSTPRIAEGRQRS